MNGYVAFYGNKRVEVYAETTYAAQKEVQRLLKVPPKKAYMISVTLAEKDGECVEHTAS